MTAQSGHGRGPGAAAAATLPSQITGVHSTGAVVKTAAVVTLLGAAVIHLSVVPEHLEEWTAAGFFFAILCVVEAALAVWLARSPSRPALIATVAVSLATICVWLVSRTVGMPMGPEAGEAEAVGAPDAIATLFEGVTAGALLMLFAPRTREMASNRLTPTAARVAIGGLVVAVALMTTFALTQLGEESEETEEAAAVTQPVV